MRATRQPMPRLILGLCLTAPMPPALAFIDVTPPVISPITSPAAIQQLTPVVSIDIAADNLLVDGAGDLISITEDSVGVSAQDYFPTGVVGLLSPGRHTIEWKATDAGSNVHIVNQVVDVLPTVNITVDQVMGEGGSAQVCVYLNGTAPAPLVLPYTIGGTATAGIDHDAAAASFNLAAGDSRACITINITPDLIGDEGETVVINITPLPAGVMAGNKLIHTLTTTDVNLAPVAMPSISQNAQLTRTVIANSQLVTINANASDPNGDVITYDWSGTDNTLLAIATDNGGNITFSPAGLAPGFYTVRFTTSDSTNSSQHSILMAVTDAPLLSTLVDSDDDSINDNVEGVGDSDNDGLVNYLDALSVPYQLQAWPLTLFDATPKTSKSYSALNLTYQWRIASTPASNQVMYTLLATTGPGLNLSIGRNAFIGGLGHARLRVVTLATMLSVSAPVNRTPIDGHMVDLVISGLSAPGRVARVVIPQAGPVPPADAPAELYVIDNSGNFALFDAADTEEGIVTTGGANLIAGAYCPDTHAAAYGAIGNSISFGDQCLLIAVRDGGPNDRDGEANGTIRLTAGIFIPATNPQTSTPPLSPPAGIKETVVPGNRTDAGVGSGATGSLGWFGLMMLVLAVYLRRGQWSLMPPKRCVSRLSR